MKFESILLTSALSIVAACSSKSDNVSESKKIDAICVDSQKPEQTKCTDYQGFAESAESTYAKSCEGQAGVWTKGSQCEMEPGTRGCRSESSGGGPTITTWYKGDGYKNTDILCADLVPVTK